MGKLGEILRHPDELIPLVSIYIKSRKAKQLPKAPGLRFCYDMLNKVSRSFAVVTQQLPENLRDAVCVFYLVLRALDTVEDDMSLEDDVKIPLLRCFYEKSRDSSWKMVCGDGHYRDLMENYPLVTEVFLSLDREFQLVIEDVCKKMGNGMADFIPKEVKTVEEYNLYCHYVAGLVGVGLSQLFASSGLESKEYFKLQDMSNEMGLFLQKTNIIRDYLEDINEEPAPRMFWPKEIWGNYSRRLADFKLDKNSDKAVACLNHMICDALGHVDQCLEYMAKLRNPSIFAFCAIPQVMAIGTLEACFNNHDVFTGVVKMRRGEVAKIMWFLKDYTDLCILFRHYARLIASRAKDEATDDPHAAEIVKICDRIESTTTKRIKQEIGKITSSAQATELPLTTKILFLIVSLMYAAYAWKLEAVRELLGLPFNSQTTAVDLINMLTAMVLISYSIISLIIGFSSVKYE